MGPNLADTWKAEVEPEPNPKCDVFGIGSLPYPNYLVIASCKLKYKLVYISTSSLYEKGLQMPFRISLQRIMAITNAPTELNRRK